MKVREVMKDEKVMRPRPKLKDFFSDENYQIFHCLQSLFMNISLAGFSISSFDNRSLSTLPGFYLQDLYFPLIMSILDPALKKASPQRALSVSRRSEGGKNQD